MVKQYPLPPPLSNKRYERDLFRLQIELVKLQRHVIVRGQRVHVIQRPNPDVVFTYDARNYERGFIAA